MHIPFTRDKIIADGQHVITLTDHSRQDDDEDRDDLDSVPDPSPVLENERLPSILERPIKANVQHSIEVADGLVDVLYENQRGSFLCGIPLYSAAGLWVTDPHAWTSIDHKYTPFTIFNATIPDPTWEWVWKRWFVDMSGDVDENGWMYNINFTRHHWHGHHIWYHSFVRRRRWLRKRRKVATKDRVALRKRNPAEDYFTIYSASRSLKTSQKQSTNDYSVYDQDEDDTPVKLENFGEFYEKLRGARLDREKLDAVDNFLHNGKDLAGLAGEMRHILKFMIFQESRRRLLELLTAHCRVLEQTHLEHDADEEEAGSTDGSNHQCVKDAIEMADLLINKLDYFSDRIKVSRAEQDEELDRITSERLHQLSAARERRRHREIAEEEEEQASLDTVSNSGVASMTQERLRRPNAGSRKVSFADESSSTMAADVKASKQKEEKDETIVEEQEEESPSPSGVSNTTHGSKRDKGKEKEWY